MSEFAIGIDLGGTNLRAAALTRDGKCIVERRLATAGDEGADTVLDRAASLVGAIQAELADDRLVGVGMGLPGLIRARDGVVTAAPNVWAELDVAAKTAMEQRLAMPVAIENDANAAALGEFWLGAGKDVDDLILITLGTGVGGGIVAGGRVIRGCDGMAGEIGHMTLDPASKVRCGCGNFGCLETEASATAIVRKARQAATASPAISGLMAADTLTAATVAELAAGGDAAAIAVYESVGIALGIALGNLISVFNFPLQLLAGGVAPAWDLFAPAMLRELRGRCLTDRVCPARIERAVLGADAGVVGAAYLAWQSESS